MGFNKIAYFRYRAIDELFRSGGVYNLAEITENIKGKLKNAFDIEYISERQIAEDLKIMRSASPIGYKAPIINIRGVGYKYSDKSFSINNLNYTNEELEIIRNAILLLKYNNSLYETNSRLNLLAKLTGYPTEFPFILKEPTVIKGVEYINDVINAILNNQIIEISYKPFHANFVKKDLIMPVLLKEYRNRLYLIAKNTTDSNRMVYATDRIESISIQNQFYKISNKEKNALLKLYETCIGTSIEYDQVPELVIIEVSSQIKPYLIMRPLHKSQKYIKDLKNGWHRFSLDIIINIELVSELLKFNKEVKIISPETLKNKTLSLLKETFKNY